MAKYHNEINADGVKPQVVKIPNLKYVDTLLYQIMIIDTMEKHQIC